MRTYRYLLFFCWLAAMPRVWAQAPEVPVITRLSLNTEGKLELSWTISDPTAVDGYIVVRRIFGSDGIIDGTFHDVATVAGGASNFYVDLSTSFAAPQPDLRPESYRLKSYKLVGGQPVVSQNMSAPHNSIHLLPPSFDWCAESTRLVWTHYLGWEGALSSYIVYGRAAGATAYTQLGSVPATDSVFVHQKPPLDTQYEYYVTAVNGRTLLRTRSNGQTVETATPRPPDLFNADYGTVQGSDLKLRFSVGASSDVLHYVLQRSDSPETAPRDIAVLKPTADSIVFMLAGANLAQVQYFRLKAVGVCGKDIGFSNWAQNISCKAEITDQNEGINQIDWTAYTQWRGTVKNYHLYRSIDQQPAELLQSYPANTLSTIDNVGHFKQESYNGNAVAGRFCYWLVAEEQNNPMGVVASSTSPVVCVRYQRFILAPTAINPLSEFPENRVFRPQVSFVSNFSLKIYNRWGSTVFVATNPQDGWDGTLGGKPAPPGLYVYFIEFDDASGVHTFHQGELSVVY